MTNSKYQKGTVQYPLIIGAAILLVIGVLAGRLTTPKSSQVKNDTNSVAVTPTADTVSTSSATQAASSTETKGKISGYLIYPSSFIPEDLGVCAQRIDNQSLVFCTEQIKDKKYQNGVGYEMSLDPGNYYVYSFLGDNRAYYTEFVLCGLKAECQSHTKIPVTVSAGSSQDNILPHDWYDFGPTETDQPLPSSTIAPTATSVPIIPIVSIKIDKDIIMKIAPTATPTPKALVIPSVKIKIPELSW